MEPLEGKRYSAKLQHHINSIIDQSMHTDIEKHEHVSKHVTYRCLAAPVWTAAPVMINLLPKAGRFLNPSGDYTLGIKDLAVQLTCWYPATLSLLILCAIVARN